MYLGDLAKRNKNEVFVVGFFNLALLVILLLPFMGIMMLVNAHERTDWQSPGNVADQYNSLTWSIASGDGVLELTSVTSDNLDQLPLEYQARPFGCAAGVGSVAPDEFIRYIEDLDCSSVLKNTAVKDSRTVNIVTPLDRMAGGVNTGTSDSMPVIDLTIVYLVLVYLIVVAIPCLVCFWSVSKIFEPAWVETARVFALRGFSKRAASLLLSAAPLAGLLASVVVSVVPLYAVSRILKNVVWEGRGFLPEDALVGLIGAFGGAMLITFLMGAVTYLRRMRLFATVV